jgi:hypothetical protein
MFPTRFVFTGSGERRRVYSPTNVLGFHPVIYLHVIYGGNPLIVGQHVSILKPTPAFCDTEQLKGSFDSVLATVTCSVTCM